jgi:hypothetical protein
MRHFFDGSTERFWSAHGFDDDVGAAAIGQFKQTLMERFPQTVDPMNAAGKPRQGELIVIDVDRNRLRPPGACSRNSAKAYASATQDGDDIFGCHAPAGHRMKTNGQRFDQAEFFEGKPCRIESFWRHNNVFGEGAVPLHSHGLIELAGIGAPAAAGSTFSAIGIR